MARQRSQSESAAVHRLTAAPTPPPAPPATPMRAYAALSRDWTAFCLKRLDRDFAAWREISEADTPAEAAFSWGRAAQGAFTDYATQTGRMMGVLLGKTEN